ncbi:hypothetical protein JGT29_25240, partial [Enterobacter hormaechei]|nr:hypothetical protein [Enterobacter hormaechei]
ELAVAGQMVQLAEHRLALRREELETRNARRERVVTELVVAQEGLIGMQAGHGTSFISKLVGQGPIVGAQGRVQDLTGKIAGDHGIPQSLQQNQTQAAIEHF